MAATFQSSARHYDNVRWHLDCRSLAANAGLPNNSPEQLAGNTIHRPAANLFTDLLERFWSYGGARFNLLPSPIRVCALPRAVPTPQARKTPDNSNGAAA